MTSLRGCAGVALTGALASEFSELTAAPLAAVEIQQLPDLQEWTGGVPLAPLWAFDLAPGVRWELSERPPDRALVFSVNGAPRLVADIAGQAILLAGGSASFAAQQVASIGAPAIAAARGAIPVHGASMTDGQHGATLVVGASGAGKSSLLTASIDDGWQPISEDLTMVDVAADGTSRAWPGPPWVRLGPGSDGPRGSRQRPDPTDKISWELTGRLPTAPIPLQRIIVLGKPGGAAPSLTELSPMQAIAELPPHIAWLSSSPRATAAFSAAVTLSRRVPTFRLEVPRQVDWARLAVEVISDL